MGRHGLDCSGSGQRQMATCCECSNEPSDSVKCGEFLLLAKELLASQEGLCSIESGGPGASRIAGHFRNVLRVAATTDHRPIRRYN
jgi:hypothetical protein